MRPPATSQAVVLTLMLVFGAAWATQEKVTTSKNLRTTSSPADKESIVVELVIFCDNAFTNVFHGDNQKFLSYWHQVIWNVDLRFKYLQTVDVSFRVNAIVKLQDSEKKELLQDVPSTDGKYCWKNVTSKFGHWLYTKSSKQGMGSYDIAVLALRTKFDGARGAAYVGRACSMDVFNRKISSILILSMWNTEVDHTLTHEIAHLLNAPHDYDKSQYISHNCTEFNVTQGVYIMGRGRSGFSPCSKKSIASFVKTDQASCLRNIGSPATPVIDTSSSCTEDAISDGVSLAEQCQIFTDYKNAFTTFGRNSCLSAKCHVSLGNNSLSGNTTFNPFEFTKCAFNGYAGYCRRGACIPHGGKSLIHVATGKCLGNENTISTNSRLILYDCFNSTMAIDFVHSKTSNFTGYLVASYKNKFTQQRKHKLCLGFSTEVHHVTFQNCTSDAQRILWELYADTENSRNVSKNFVLYHNHSRVCLQPDQDFKYLEIAKGCFLNNTKQLWRFEDKMEERKQAQCSRNQTSAARSICFEASVSWISVVTFVVFTELFLH